MNVLKLILQFVLSGSVVVGATLISKYFDSKWAGLLVALPVMTILGFVFISVDSNLAVSQRYLLSALLFMIPAAVYILSLYLLYGRFSLISTCLISLIPMGIVILLIQKLV